MSKRGRKWVGVALATTIALAVGLLGQFSAHAVVTTGFTGTVVDAEGDPMASTEIVLWRKLPPGALSQYGGVKSVQTDERGVFRVGVRPGRYLLEVVPGRDRMFGEYYYATVVGAPHVATNSYQPAEGSLFYVDFPGNRYAVNPTKVARGQVIDFGTTTMRQGGMVEGKVVCPGISDHRGVIHPDLVNAKGKVLETLSTSVDIDRSGSYASRTPWPVGHVRLNYALDNCPFGRDPSMGYSAYLTSKVSKATTTTLVPITKRPVAPSIRPSIRGTARLGHTLWLRPGEWPAGTETMRSWKTRYGVVQGRRLDLRYDDDRGYVRGIVVASKPGHFAAVVRTKRRLVR